MIKRENVGLKKKAFWLVYNATLSTNAAENVKKEIRGNKIRNCAKILTLEKR